MGIGKDFLIVRSTGNKARVNKYEYIGLRNSCTKWRWNQLNEEIFANYATDR